MLMKIGIKMQTNSASVWPDWAIYILWATFQSPWQQLFCPNRQHILGNFYKGVKIFHFTREILFGQLLWTFGNFLLVTLFIINTVCYHQLISMYRVVSTQQLYLHYPKSVDFNWITYSEVHCSQHLLKGTIIGSNLLKISQKLKL